MKIKKRLLLIFFITSSAVPCFGQSFIPGQQEAPPSLFQTELGDADVDLYFLGSWLFTLTGSLGFGYNTDQKTFVSTPFPGMEPGVLFKQVPDLTLSLWLMNQYFFETSLAEDYTFNTFLLGYEAPEEKDGFLRSVRIGNTDVSIGDYGFLTLSAPPKNSIGASAKMRSTVSKHELMLRYDPAEVREKNYIGSDEVTEEDIHLKDYLRGKMFILPDDDVDSITVYVETEGGTYPGSDGRYYDILEDGKAVISKEKGTIFFKQAQSRRILVSYTKNGLSVGNAALGKNFLCGLTGGEIDTDAAPVDFSWTVTYLGEALSERKVTVDGRTCLLVYQEGQFSPFEYQNTYAVSGTVPEDAWRTQCTLVRKDDLDGGGDQISVETDSENSLLSVFYSGIPYRSPKNRYPFAGKYPENYGPQCETNEGFFSHFLRVSIRSEESEYNIGADVIPGSEYISVNGREESRYTIDYDTGKITFLRFIFPTDRIHITYKTSSDTAGGNINVALGNTFQLSKGLALNVGLGFSWNVLTGTYTYSEDTNPGSVLASSTLSYEGKNIKTSLDAGFSLSTLDTRGIYRILGMEKAGVYFSMSENTALPASIPLGFADAAGTITLDAESRGELIYKNYRNSTLFTGIQLMPYSWSVPSSQIFPYETGSKTGPYITATEDTESDSRVMVLDFSMTPTRNWVGAQIPISDVPEGVNLGDTRSISFFWKGENIPDNAKVFLHIGAVGEDLDGDGRLDEEGSKADQGYSFNDAASGQVLLIGGGPDGSGNNILDSEDRNNNDILDWDVDSAIVKKDLTPPGSGWTLEEIPLSASDRAKLHSCRSMRIYLYYPGSSDVSGRLLIGDFSFDGAPFFTRADSPGTVTAKEIFEFQEGTASEDQLPSLYPDVTKIFHNDDSSQKVLQIQWADVPDNTSWQATGYTGAVPLDRYRDLVFYMKTPSLAADAGSTISLSITGSDGKGLKISLPAVSYQDWKEFTVDLTGKTVSIGGVVIPNAAVTYTETSASAAKLVISGTDTQSGTMMIDEIHLRESVPSGSAGFKARFSYAHPEPVLQAGDTTLFGNFSIDQTVSGYLKNFAAGYAGDISANSFRSLTVTGFDLLFTKFNINLDILYSDPELYVSGGHRIRFPASSSIIAVEDKYNQEESSSGLQFSRIDSLSLQVPKAVQLKTSQSVYRTSELLTQNWNGAVSTALDIPLSISGDFTLQQVSESPRTEAVNYFSDWIGSYSYFLPWDGDETPERNWATAAAVNLKTAPVGLEIKHTFGFRNYGISERKQQNTADLLFTVPLQFNKDTPFAWSVTPVYERTFSYTTYPSSTGTFASDFTRYGTAYGVQRYFYTNPPFYELFSREAVTAFSLASQGAPAVVFSPLTGISLNRKSGSFLWDLFIPSKLALQMQRTLERSEEEIIDSFTWSLQLRASALNLFGRLGAYPLFKFYDTEELSTSFQIAQTETVDIPPKETVLRLQNMWYFQGQKKQELTLNNRLDIAIDETARVVDKVTAGFSWQFPAPFSLEWKFIPEEKRKNLFFKNTESAEVTFGPGFDTGNPGIAFECFLEHTTSMIVPQFGHASAHLALGVRKNTPVVWYFGAELGIEVQISF